MSFAGDGVIPRIVRLFVEGSAHTGKSDSLDGSNEPLREASPVPERSFTHQTLLLMYCASGLLVSYLIWGLLQERIMAYDYSESGTGRERFKNSQFLVFMNRILAFFVACIAVTARRVKSRQPPLYKYSYGSFSNIMSSWCQYEALKFVSFPVQVRLSLCMQVASVRVSACIKTLYEQQRQKCKKTCCLH
jgi:D-alanyl-lipoteichoic acid acyltransferase DltB (MBOAT superfamily)